MSSCDKTIFPTHTEFFYEGPQKKKRDNSAVNGDVGIVVTKRRATDRRHSSGNQELYHRVVDNLGANYFDQNQSPDSGLHRSPASVTSDSPYDFSNSPRNSGKIPDFSFGTPTSVPEFSPKPSPGKPSASDSSSATKFIIEVSGSQQMEVSNLELMPNLELSDEWLEEFDEKLLEDEIPAALMTDDEAPDVDVLYSALEALDEQEGGPEPQLAFFSLEAYQPPVGLADLPQPEAAVPLASELIQRGAVYSHSVNLACMSAPIQMMPYGRQRTVDIAALSVGDDVPSAAVPPVPRRDLSRKQEMRAQAVSVSPESRAALVTGKPRTKKLFGFKRSTSALRVAPSGPAVEKPIASVSDLGLEPQMMAPRAAAATQAVEKQITVKELIFEAQRTSPRAAASTPALAPLSGLEDLTEGIPEKKVYESLLDSDGTKLSSVRQRAYVSSVRLRSESPRLRRKATPAEDEPQIRLPTATEDVSRSLDSRRETWSPVAIFAVVGALAATAFFFRWFWL